MAATTVLPFKHIIRVACAEHTIFSSGELAFLCDRLMDRGHIITFSNVMFTTFLHILYPSLSHSVAVSVGRNHGEYIIVVYYIKT